ncbi:MAG TPA: hypothetical protein VN494_08525 [Patescibacteria group bacterium]|nr:hypothetical protein [Patescibacteria group bacterium]
MVWPAYNGYYTPFKDRDGSPTIPGYSLKNPHVGDALGLREHREQRVVGGTATLLGVIPLQCTLLDAVSLKDAGVEVKRVALRLGGKPGSRLHVHGGLKVSVIAFGVKRQKKRVTVAVPASFRPSLVSVSNQLTPR